MCFRNGLKCPLVHRLLSVLFLSDSSGTFEFHLLQSVIDLSTLFQSLSNFESIISQGECARVSSDYLGNKLK